ncbi:glycosyltransferase family 2 protein [soil metagenome]
MIVLDVILTAMALALLIPAAIYFLECMIAVFRGASAPLALSDFRPRVTVVVPAHDEQGNVGDTVRHLWRQLEDHDRLIVVADNCTDDTSAEAVQAGAEVWIRIDAARRGKGYAISFALDRLAAAPPEILVFVDADCRLSDHAIDTISRAALTYQRPVQAEYLLSAPSGAGPLASVSALAYLIRDLVRPLGLHHLGLPCHLTGTGMAFPWQQIRQAPAQQAHLVEDLVIGLELAIAGHPPLLCHEAKVHGSLPDTAQGAKSQRRRWEHGQMSTAMSHGGRLLREGIQQRRGSLLALAADLSVPPLALLVAMLIGVSVLAGLGALLGAGSLALIATMFALVLVVIATTAAWWRFGRRLVPFWSLLLAPAYMVWKLPLYAAFFFRKQQRDWVRTERNRGGSRRDDI